MLNIAALNVAIYGILRNLIEIVLLLCLLAYDLLCFPNLLCFARKFGKGLLLLG